jgi:nitrite reductase/ring-hydroxylating ferredoxin subunit
MAEEFRFTEAGPSQQPSAEGVRAVASTNSSAEVGTGRRSWLACVLGWGAAILAYVTPVFAGLRAFLAAGGRSGAQAGQFRRLATLDMLPADGSPVTVPVLAERLDAWNRFPAQPIGAVLLRRTPEGKVTALNVRCPHAGCTVVYESAKKRLFCPCHAASFDFDGRRLEANSQSPRDLDPLDVEVREGGEIWVRFQHFRTGVPDRVPE